MNLEQFIMKSVLFYEDAPVKSPAKFIAPDGGFYDEVDLSSLDVWMNEILPALAKKTEDVKIWVFEGSYFVCTYTYPEIIEVSDSNLIESLKKMMTRYQELKSIYTQEDSL